MLQGNYFVYIVTNPGKTVLYVGVTNDLVTRLQQHRDNRGNKKSFAGKYYCYNLIYYERFSNVHLAIEREKELKNLTRDKKEALINQENPEWDTLVVYE